jgi:hypothetical protein
MTAKWEPTLPSIVVEIVADQTTGLSLKFERVIEDQRSRGFVLHSFALGKDVLMAVFARQLP